MTVPRMLTLVMVALLVMGLGVSASADWTKTSYLTGNLVTGTQGLKCDALVTVLGNVYTYSYTLTFSAGVAPIHTYKVYNPQTSGFFGGTNTDGFTNPANGTAAQIQWLNGTMAVGTSCVFTYQSYCAPQDIDVYTYAIDTGRSAYGRTLGMGAMIPEPSSLAALLFGAAGLLPLVTRRRK